MHSEGPHLGETGHHRHLHVVALDTPETDSYIKQMSVMLGEWCNHHMIHVTKDGNQGIQPWQMVNHKYNGGPAHPDIIDTPTLSPSGGLPQAPVR